MIDFTVAIPTYNGADRLPDVLERLRSQLHLDSFEWEVIVVDNNSTDSTENVVKKYQKEWINNCKLYYYFEPEQGAAFARQKAVDLAKSGLIGFLDDDNLPTSNWVISAYQFAQAHPKVGAFGSEIQGDFAIPPANSLSALYHFLGIIERGNLPSYYSPKERILPPAAGLVIRKEAWQNAVPKRLFLNHKGKEAGLASEDLEAVLYIQKAGWELWHNPDMKIFHKIPATRLEKEYLLSLCRCIGLSRHHLRMIRLKPWQCLIATPIYWLNDVFKLLKHIIFFSKQVKKDVIFACDRQLLISSVLSPFFLAKIYWQEQVHLLKSNSLISFFKPPLKKHP
ncbi:MAG: hormogonium polysaccharide biosynthesis glycosyltransferase HpsE, partial [Chroococcales cyanobacterium]